VPSDKIISTSQVSKRFGQTVALDRFTMEVAQGEVHGFLGPNGAGRVRLFECCGA